MIEKEQFFTLSSPLENYREALEGSARTYIKLQLSYAETNTTQSKIGGTPYLPQEASYPIDVHGEYMLLLAQINFSEGVFPKPFPQEGLLQFFISPSVYSLAADVTGVIDPQWYSIRFITQLIDDEPFIANDIILDALLPTLKLHFSKEVEPVSATDYRFFQFVSTQMMQNFAQDVYQPFEEIYAQSFLAADQKIGGYPYFIEEDFRSTASQYKQLDTLLFQLVSDDALNFMWGDSGVLKFFITSQDLAQCNFSNVVFYSESY